MYEIIDWYFRAWFYESALIYTNIHFRENPDFHFWMFQYAQWLTADQRVTTSKI